MDVGTAKNHREEDNHDEKYDNDDDDRSHFCQREGKLMLGLDNKEDNHHDHVDL